MKKQVLPPYVEINKSSSNRLKQQLQDEITNLEQQLYNLENSDESIDFSMIQTYKEMLHDRRGMMQHMNSSRH